MNLVQFMSVKLLRNAEMCVKNVERKNVNNRLNHWATVTKIHYIISVFVSDGKMRTCVLKRQTLVNRCCASDAKYSVFQKES